MLPGVTLLAAGVLKPSNCSQKNFGDIHIDVKFLEEADSGVIFLKKSFEKGQKSDFVKALSQSGN